MREIKFRAWLKARKQMVEVIKIEFFSVGIPGIMIAYIKDGQICTAYPGDFEIMQFIGSYDKNGKEVYEGDIVRDLYGSLYIVEWDIVKIAFRGVPARSVCKIDTVYAHELEVIGNIYENPELFGGAK